MSKSKGGEMGGAVTIGPSWAGVQREQACLGSKGCGCGRGSCLARLTIGRAQGSGRGANTGLSPGCASDTHPRRGCLAGCPLPRTELFLTERSVRLLPRHKAAALPSAVGCAPSHSRRVPRSSWSPGGSGSRVCARLRLPECLRCLFTAARGPLSPAAPWGQQLCR